MLKSWASMSSDFIALLDKWCWPISTKMYLCAFLLSLFPRELDWLGIFPANTSMGLDLKAILPAGGLFVTTSHTTSAMETGELMYFVLCRCCSKDSLPDAFSIYHSCLIMEKLPWYCIKVVSLPVISCIKVVKLWFVLWIWIMNHGVQLKTLK